MIVRSPVRLHQSGPACACWVHGADFESLPSRYTVVSAPVVAQMTAHIWSSYKQCTVLWATCGNVESPHVIAQMNMCSAGGRLPRRLSASPTAACGWAARCERRTGPVEIRGAIRGSAWGVGGLLPRTIRSDPAMMTHPVSCVVNGVGCPRGSSISQVPQDWTDGKRQRDPV
jgi:hypothetical protein